MFVFVSASVSTLFSVFFLLLLFCFWKVAAFAAFSISQPGPAPGPPSQPAPHACSPRSQRPPHPPHQALPRAQQPRPFISTVQTYKHIQCFAIGAAMGNVLNPKKHCFAIGTVVGSIINPKQYCFAISAALGSIPNPKQYCFAISAAMGSILNPKQYCHQQHHYPQGADKLDA